MIIVSQDKDVIINFDNVEDLWINNPLENDNGNFEIRAETHSNNINIGEYQTIERAKEVLKEIIEQFTVSKIENSNYEYADLVMKVKKLSAYEMPEK